MLLFSDALSELQDLYLIESILFEVMLLLTGIQPAKDITNLNTLKRWLNVLSPIIHFKKINTFILNNVCLLKVSH